MNYRHGYHAGNFADVFKHLVLITLLDSLLRKDKPFFYLDTHAGSGEYSLLSDWAKKTGEAQQGIGKIVGVGDDNIPAMVERYVDIIHRLGYPEYYPGSPMIAKYLLRSSDRMGLTELHSHEVFLLKDLFKGNSSVSVHHQDGYQAIKAFLPPKERRGLIFMDPPFEKSTEWDDIIDALKVGMKKFSTGIYAVWYPNKEVKQVQKFLNTVGLEEWPNVVSIEFNIYPQDAPLHLIGCGMLIINAPWQFEAEIKQWLPWVREKLN